MSVQISSSVNGGPGSPRGSGSGRHASDSKEARPEYRRPTVASPPGQIAKMACCRQIVWLSRPSYRSGAWRASTGYIVVVLECPCVLARTATNRSAEPLGMNSIRAIRCQPLGADRADRRVAAEQWVSLRQTGNRHSWPGLGVTVLLGSPCDRSRLRASHCGEQRTVE